MSVTTTTSVLVAALILIGLHLWYTKMPHSKDKERAIQFLDDLSKQIEDILMDVVNHIDIKSFSTLEELEVAIFSIADGKIWDFVSAQLQLAIDNKAISTVVAALVTRENVELLINALFAKCDVMMIAGAKWNAELEEEYVEAEKFEKEIAERNRQLRTGTVPDVDEKNFVPPDYHPEPVNGSIIPPSDEELPVSDDDDTVIPIDGDVDSDVLPENKEE